MTNTLEHLSQNSDTTTPEQDRKDILNDAYEMQRRQTLSVKLTKTAESLYSFENLDPKDIINE